MLIPGEKREVISSGLQLLDNALNKGGFEEGSVIVFIGDAGSRKDLFGYHFLMDGLMNDEHVVFYDVEASSDEIYGLVSETQEQTGKGQLEFIDACPEYTKFYINAVPAKIIDHMKYVDNVKRILINPLTFFIEAFGVKDAGDFIILIREIAMKRGLVVVLLLADIIGKLEVQSIIDKCDGVIELKSEPISEDIIRSIVVKKLGMGQKEVTLSYRVTETKITITSTGRII